MLMHEKRDIAITNPSVRLTFCPSVSVMPVLHLNEWTYRYYDFLVFRSHRCYKISRGAPQRGR